MPDRTLRILNVEDSEDDYILVHREIRRAGIVASSMRVDCPDSFREALSSAPWDLVVADYSMPGFSGVDALRILKESGLDIPFILVSGTVGEDIAVNCMKLGASDYLLKGQLARLGPAIEREVREARVRSERRTAERALKLADESLRQTVSLLRATIESTEDGILAVGSDGRITIHNRKFRAVSGVSSELVDAGDAAAVISNIVSRLVNPEDFAGLAERIFGGGRQWFGAEGFRHLEFKDGRSAEAFVVPQWLEDRCLGHVLCVRDVTERKRAEEVRRRIETQLFESQKMEALGALAGGVAHDFNNLLSVMLNYAELLGAKTTGNSEVAAYVERMRMAGRRAADLVRQILLFSRRQKQELRPMHLQDAISEAVQLIRATLPQSISLVTEISPRAPEILADTTQIHQVLMNLCINGAQAMAARPGRIVVTVTTETVSPELAARTPGAHVGPHVVLQVKDDGPGMSQETLSHIFEPFFTTKEKGKGTGLGLAVVHGIIRSHNAFITVDSEPGEGATFRIRFPVYDDGIADFVSTDGTPDRLSVRRIFFVDDDPDVCSVTAQILSSAGYEVTAFKDPIRALDAFQKDAFAADALVTDVNMPAMNGVELARKCLALRPDLPVLMVSGFSGNWTPESVRKMGVIDLLAKPVSPGQIALRLNRIFEKRPAAGGSATES